MNPINKVSTMSIFIMSLISGMVFERYIYGGMIFVLSVLMTAQYMILQSGSQQLIKYSPLTRIPVIIQLVLVILTSAYILVKSVETDITKKIMSVIPLVASLGLGIAIYFLQSSAPLFKTSMMNFIPVLLMIVFFLLISVIKDNQIILMKLYKDTKQNIDTI